MLLNWLDIRVARLGLAIALIGITTLALMPAHDVPATSGWDKLDHWFAFFVLAALTDRSSHSRLFWMRTLPLLVAYGIGIEVAQYFTPDRDADAFDVVADSIGILVYGGVRQLVALAFMRSAGEPRPE